MAGSWECKARMGWWRVLLRQRVERSLIPIEGMYQALIIIMFVRQSNLQSALRHLRGFPLEAHSLALIDFLLSDLLRCGTAHEDEWQYINKAH